MTHPFHPRTGQLLTLTTRRHNWGEDRVMYFDEAGKLRSMPTSWTSVDKEDTFQRASAGRSWFRVDDLLELATLTQALKNIQRKV
ncbi:MAG: DUF5372 family protein [Halioglobus sp.]